MNASRFQFGLVLVGFLGHAPGLWLFHRRSQPASARRENPIAVLATLAALAAAWMADVDWRWLLVIWLLCHLAWGARLAYLLWRDHEAPPQA